MISTTIHLTRYDVSENEEREFEVKVTFDFHKGCRGYRDSMGVPEEPDTPAELEFIEATTNGKEIELTKKEIEAAKQKVWKQLEKGQEP